MLTIVLIGIIFVMSVIVAILARLLLRADKEYAALEKGMQEIEENYEQEFLTWDEVQKEQEGIIQSRQERIDVLEKDLATLHYVAEHHATNCIPDYAPVLGREEYICLAEHSQVPEKYVDKIMEHISG